MKTLKSILVIVVILLASTAIQAQEIFDAVKSNDLTKVKTLVETNPQIVNAKDETGRTPLHWACRGVHFEVLKYLVEKGADVNALDNNVVAPLHSLVTRSHIEGITYLLAHKADVNKKSANNFTPLHYAAGMGNPTVVKLLLNHGAEPSAKAVNGDTPLFFAVDGGFKEIIDLLLDKGADFDTTGSKALDMLQISARNGLERSFKRIIEKEGDNLFADKGENISTMQDAISGGSVEIVKILLAKNIPLVKKADIYGWIPIHYAASNGRLAMVEFLIGNGVDINARNYSGESAYNMAEAKNNKELQDLIIKKGGNAEPKNFLILKGSYFGQKVPGSIPEIFAPGIVSTSVHEFSSCFSPDGNEFYFTRTQQELGQNIIMYTKLVDGVWTEPAVAPFAEPFTFEPFVTPDNKRVYFQTGKVVGGQLQMFTMYADRTDSGWSEAKDPGEPFNPMKTMYISASINGTIYTTDISGGFTTQTEKGSSGPGKECLGMIKPIDGKYEKLEKLGPPLNQEPLSQYPWIAPDESYMIYTVIRSEQNPASVLFCTFKDKDGKWTEPKELRLGIKAGQPFVSFDGKYLFFTSGDPEKGSDIYWVSTKIIDELKPKE